MTFADKIEIDKKKIKMKLWMKVYKKAIITHKTEDGAKKIANKAVRNFEKAFGINEIKEK